MLDQYGFDTEVIHTTTVRDGCWVEERNGLYRVTKRERSSGRPKWVPGAQDILTADEYTHLWATNIVCDEYFATKPELERMSTRIARLEREIGEPITKRFAPYWQWKDETTFVYVFDGGTDEDGDEYFYNFECWTDDGLQFHFGVMYDYDHFEVTDEFSPAQLLVFKQLMTSIMSESKGMDGFVAKKCGWLL